MVDAVTGGLVKGHCAVTFFVHPTDAGTSVVQQVVAPATPATSWLCQKRLPTIILV